MRWTPKKWNRTRRVGPRPWARTCCGCGDRFAFESGWAQNWSAGPPPSARIYTDYLCAGCGSGLGPDEQFRNQGRRRDRRARSDLGGPVPAIIGPMDDGSPGPRPALGPNLGSPAPPILVRLPFSPPNRQDAGSGP